MPRDSTPPDDFDFAPDAPEFYQRDPEAAFRWLRAHDPVHWYEPARFWCITRQAELRDVSRTPRVFSSAHGTLIPHIAVVHDGGAIVPAGMEDAVSIIQMDPPAHNRHRKLVMEGFKPRYVEGLEPRIRAITRATLDACAGAGEIDFVEQVAVPLPMLVIAELIGIPGSDLATFRRWSDAIIEAGNGGATEAVQQSVMELFGYFTARLAEPRTAGRDDIIAVLQDAEIDGERLREGEILMFLMTLLIAGNETTRNLIAGGGRALAEHPAQRAALVADPGGIPNAVEEMLRWVSPVRSFIRRALEDTTLADTPIRKDDFVVLFYGAANRDESVFGSTAGRFDTTRPDANRHVAFGFGEHLCLGASLARLEARVMFEELLARWPTYEITGPIEPLESCLMNGLVRMPVRI